jgi:phosphatidylglycerophosphate synthase
MIFFDLTLLLLTSAVLATKNLYLGSVTLIIGLFIAFQNIRTIRLLGSQSRESSRTRQIKAAILALIFGLCTLPLLIDDMRPEALVDQSWSEVASLPLVIVVGLFAATMMSALANEKRKR